MVFVISRSLLNILSPEKQLYCGVDTVGPHHPVNVAIKRCVTGNG